MEVMCDKIPLGACPTCGHLQFVVFETEQNMFLTDKDGEIINTEETYYEASGMCARCGKSYKMFPTSKGFIPMTKMRELLFDLYYEEDENLNIENPMEMKR